ncbi:GNAT family N-acetyltransferase [Blastococcus sp. CCUG 61487]|uniref:GNAT family N-acetyltransferase n=1 Tax=Blastococcus sp. CCUG 61487 TaxID=1840703 RepID=UPI0010C07E77|nr:GNAT family N-acetyltransferase [Blastococcus sp. CCUG 61487]TKJ18225.1 aminoglycoside 2'-N-acetyltransferase [Blastococcus sp. CCUG 61487]
MGRALIGPALIGPVLVAHTAQVEPHVLDSVRRLLDEAFAGDFDDDDFEHALGGMHALVHDGGELVGHGAVVQRRLLHRGRSLRAGYVEAVAVAAGRRRQGIASMVMAALERVVRSAYDLGALSSSTAGAPLYDARGWVRWEGPTSVLAPDGVRPTPEDDGSVHVLPGTVQLDLHGELTCDWRAGDVW